MPFRRSEADGIVVVGRLYVEETANEFVDEIVRKIGVFMGLECRRDFRVAPHVVVG